MANILQQLIVERIQREGPLSFAEYMRMALYEPGYGYYVTDRPKFGWEGDFYTSTDISPLFAHCMGRQLVQMWESLKRPFPFIVVEQGAGRGHLATGVRTWAAQQVPDFHAALDYHTEDIHTGQDATNLSLNTHTPCVILSNELVDAFPVHIVEVRDKQLYEVYVSVEQGRLCEVLDVPSSTEVANYLDTYKIPWRTYENGWRAEVNLDALRWMQQTAERLSGSLQRGKKRGFLLTIDYGDKAQALYTPSFSRGTLVCYFQHRLTERPLVRPGEQDITAHVNFSALINEGRRHGLRLHNFTTQHLWLKSMGMYDELERLRTQEFAAMDSARATDQGQVALFQWRMVQQKITALTDPDGMGGFKVLIMKR
ncbi:MAG TPA: SAM-dependent methyltransferase [Ktedonobacteraceae bacterium]|nr:SAM-dependent methyltransferase [Ktedonobacteraceae bacterium]